MLRALRKQNRGFPGCRNTITAKSGPFFGHFYLLTQAKENQISKNIHQQCQLMLFQTLSQNPFDWLIFVVIINLLALTSKSMVINL